MSIVQRTINSFKQRRERLLNGGINSIPSPYTRFQEDFLGIEQGKYYVVTSGTKGAKTQFSSYTFIYHPILYAYNHPDQVRLKIFYYPLEESKESIVARFMSFLLFIKSNIRVAPIDLMSSNNLRILDKRVLDLLESAEYKSILDFFEKTVVFSASTNPSGVWFECKKYAQENGIVHTKKQKIKGPLGETEEVDAFDYYEQSDPDEYRIIFYDHASLVNTENGKTLKQSVDKLSEYFVILRNKYGFSPVLIQQQAFAGESLDAFKEKKLRPTVANLADSKYPSRDANIVLGIFSPARYELREYMGYNIVNFKDNIRFLEVLVNRNGCMGGIVALYFDGAVCYFKELPKPDDKEGLEKVYAYIQSLKQSKKGVSFFIKSITSLFKKHGKYLFNSGKDRYWQIF